MMIGGNMKGSEDREERPDRSARTLFLHVCNSTTKAKQKRSTENAEPRVGCTNKPGDVQGEWSAIGTCALGLFAHKAHPLLQRGGGARTTIRGSLFTSTPKASVFGSTSGMLLF